VAKTGMSVIEMLHLFDEYDAWRAANQAAALQPLLCVLCLCLRVICLQL
jgi:hypothetical protein